MVDFASRLSTGKSAPAPDQNLACSVFLWNIFIANLLYSQNASHVVNILLTKLTYTSGPNLDTEMMVEFSIAFYSPTRHIYYFILKYLYIGLI